MPDTAERLEHLVETLPLGRGLGAHHGGLDLGVLVPGLTGLQIRDVDAEALRDPAERLRRRPRLAALDLAHVLLREAVAREIRLRHAGGSAKLAQPFAEPEPGLGGRDSLLLPGGG